MCGLFGIVSEAPIDPGVLEEATRVQRHRGPDAQTTRILKMGARHVGLAHQRLAIIDLSAAGIQPLLSPSGRSLIVYNGEVYNYLELRSELESLGVQFRTRTDTEVIAAACEAYGVAGALSRLNGMWAFAWLDLQSSRLVIARDRFGVKPLYIYRGKGLLAFASEIKTLLRALRLRCRVNVPVLATFIRALHLDTDEQTFFEDVVKLPAGHYAEVDASARELRLEVHRYWRLEAAPTDGLSESQAICRTRELLEDAVRLRLRSDVPVGLLLSGGLDSSAIAALASRRLADDADFAFISAVSDDPVSDESPFIHAVAHHLRRPVRTVRLQFEPQQVLPLVAQVTAQSDEPVGGFACVAQNLLMQKAQELGVTVLMSGQGADEAFCGYRKYAAFQVGSLARSGRWLAALQLIGQLLRRGTLLSQLRLADIRRYLPGPIAPRLEDIGGPALAGVPLVCPAGGGRSDVRERQRIDVESLSIPALTHWEDRNSMAWSREVRNPFLDYRIVSLGVGLPMPFKLRQGWTKFVLRAAVEDVLPPSIVWRRDKRGFTTPEARMLRRELRAEVRELLAGPTEMGRRGLIEPQAARRRFERFLRPGRLSQAVSSRDIFQLLSLELWLRAYADNLSG